jgi:Transposase, Mutator family
MANVLNKVPKSLQQAMKADLREIHGAPTRAEAEVAMDAFGEKYGAKYARATECLTKDRAALLAFYDMPAEHWDHLRTTNPIESVLATVRHRTVRTKGGVAGRFRRFAGPLERPRRGALADDGQTDGVQTGDGRRENLATAEGREPVAESFRLPTFPAGRLRP